MADKQIAGIVVQTQSFYAENKSPSINAGTAAQGHGKSVTAIAFFQRRVGLSPRDHSRIVKNGNALLGIGPDPCCVADLFVVVDSFSRFARTILSHKVPS